MQCVKCCWSIMGSYLNIHLSLFPIYVLLLLLTLSHGRPSAKIREDGFSELNLSSGDNIPLSRFSNFSAIRNNRRLISNNKFTGEKSYFSEKDDEFSTEEFATGSWRNRGGLQNHVSTAEHPNFSYKKGENPLIISPPLVPKIINENKNKKSEKSLKSLTSFTLNDGGNDVVKKISHPHNFTMGKLRLLDESSQVRGNNNKETEDEAVLEETFEEDDEKQLDKFRMNILKELGFETELLIHVNGDRNNPSQSIPTQVLPNNKWNVSKEEYLAAYAQYMFNVRQRKEQSRKNTSAKRRRKNARTRVETFYDKGSSETPKISESIGLTTFHFDIDRNKMSEGNIRIKKAIVTIPDVCQMYPRTSRSSPGELESIEDNSYDLTDTFISWMFNVDSSPFEIIGSCSSNHDNNETLSPGNARLKLLISETLLPDATSRRTKRSAQKSTLSNFKNQNKGGNSRDCAKTRRGKTCCRRSLNIKFSELGISDVIIEPKEFDAHVCVGRCNAKRVAYSSTHAMFQHIIHQTKGKKVAPRPCCTPTKLTELDVIHLDPTRTKLEVTVLKDAIVQECGCS